MDKLQWFKFCPTDWVMGKIQRCPEITQARFLKLCCLYWNKNCEISVEDAIIEIDKDHFDILVAKKIIFISDDQIYISFLDEQNVEIKETSKDKSVSGIVGNLKRWHPELYKKFSNKEITLDYAIELSKSIANLSHTDSTPIATQSQNIADKEKIKNREDKTIIDKTIYYDFLFLNLEKNNIKISIGEFEKLCQTYTQEVTEKAIKYLSDYKIEKGYKTKSDYLTLKRWVFEAIAKQNNGNTKNQPRKNDTIGGIEVSSLAKFSGASPDELSRFTANGGE